MRADESLLVWIGSSKKDLMALPTGVRKFFGHALDFAQRGDRHAAAKVMKGFDGAGVLEVVESDASGTYRAVYTVKFAEAVCVLHCFQFRREKFDNLATFGANHMVVMFVIKVMFVISFVVAKTNFTRKSGFGQKFQSPINRCMSDTWVFFLNQPIQIFARQMIFRF